MRKVGKVWFGRLFLLALLCVMVGALTLSVFLDDGPAWLQRARSRQQQVDRTFTQQFPVTRPRPAAPSPGTPGKPAQ